MGDEINTSALMRRGEVTNGRAYRVWQHGYKYILSSVFSAFDYKTYDPNCRILFMHGTKGNESMSRKAALKMKEVNPQTEIRVYDGYAHAQLMSFEQSKWIREVQSFFKNNLF